MEKVRLGRTNLMVTRCSFGALPIQRVSSDEATKILQKAYDNGINFFDTARAYSNSEEKLGIALSGVRKNIIIATKTHATTKKELFEHLATSLEKLKTDYIDIYQLHNPSELPESDELNGLYEGLLEARQKGLIRFIGITNHSIERAIDAVNSGLFDTMQFPLSSLSSEKDLRLIEICKSVDVGLVAMKALAGGLITKVASTFSFLRQYENVVPIWGIQREAELDEFITLEKNPPLLDKKMLEIIEKDRLELSGSFCRGCGYCMPCPAGIQIPTAARMSLLLRRAPYQGFLSEECKKQMQLINECIDCGECKKQCPYGLDTPAILKYMLEDYSTFYSSNKD